MKLLKYKNIFGLKYYGSYYRLMTDKGDKDRRNDVYYIIKFKKYGHYADEIKRQVKSVADYFGCKSIVALPGSTPGPSRLQDLFNSHEITRIKAVTKRKYNHHAEIEDNYKETLKILFHEIKGKILLIDDVVTTGKSILYYDKLIKNEKVLFALGINYKLNPDEIEIVAKEIQEKIFTGLNKYRFMR